MSEKVALTWNECVVITGFYFGLNDRETVKLIQIAELSKLENPTEIKEIFNSVKNKFCAISICEVVAKITLKIPNVWCKSSFYKIAEAIQNKYS